MAFIDCGCGKRIATRTEWAGKRVRCPACAAVLQIPPADVEFENPPPPEPAAATKTCPYCAEQIQAAAIRCRFCGEMLERRPGRRPGFPPRPRPAAVDDGTSILVVAILGWVICGILHPIAWSMGSSRENQCRAQGIEPSGSTKAGRLLGMIGTILMLVGVGIFVLLFVAGAAGR